MHRYLHCFLDHRKNLIREECLRNRNHRHHRIWREMVRVRLLLKKKDLFYSVILLQLFVVRVPFLLVQEQINEMLEYFSHAEQNPVKIPSLIFDHMQRFTLVGSLKFGRSRENTADKPNARLMTNPIKRNAHEYLTTNVEYLQRCNESFRRNYSFYISIESMVYQLYVFSFILYVTRCTLNM